MCIYIYICAYIYIYVHALGKVTNGITIYLLITEESFVYSGATTTNQPFFTSVSPSSKAG